MHFEGRERPEEGDQSVLSSFPNRTDQSWREKDADDWTNASSSSSDGGNTSSNEEHADHPTNQQDFQDLITHKRKRLYSEDTAVGGNSLLHDEQPVADPFIVDYSDELVERSSFSDAGDFSTRMIRSNRGLVEEDSCTADMWDDSTSEEESSDDDDDDDGDYSHTVSFCDTIDESSLVDKVNRVSRIIEAFVKADFCLTGHFPQLLTIRNRYKSCRQLMQDTECLDTIIIPFLLASAMQLASMEGTWWDSKQHDRVYPGQQCHIFRPEFRNIKDGYPSSFTMYGIQVDPHELVAYAQHFLVERNITPFPGNGSYSSHRCKVKACGKLLLEFIMDPIHAPYAAHVVQKTKRENELCLDQGGDKNCHAAVVNERGELICDFDCEHAVPCISVYRQKCTSKTPKSEQTIPSTPVLERKLPLCPKRCLCKVCMCPSHHLIRRVKGSKRPVGENDILLQGAFATTPPHLANIAFEAELRRIYYQHPDLIAARARRATKAECLRQVVRIIRSNGFLQRKRARILKYVKVKGDVSVDYFEWDADGGSTNYDFEGWDEIELDEDLVERMTKAHNRNYVPSHIKDHEVLFDACGNRKV